MKQQGFTIIELLVVIAILAALAALSVSSFFSIQKKTDVDGAAEEFVAVVKLAQSRTVSSENNAQYGVYINTSTSPDQYIMFKGLTYATREVAYDTVYALPKTVDFSNISLGGGNEIVFGKLTGTSGQSGTVSLQNKADASQAKTIYMASSGVINFTSSVPADSARVKDSRHVEFDYSRVINTATENIILTFDGAVIETIPLAENLVSGQLQWEGTITVGGADQVVNIVTHRLNDADTRFSIRRDRRHNSKSLRVALSGDASGYLANYSADGLTTGHTSIYVSNFVWQ